MKCQILFSRKSKIQMLSAEIFTHQRLVSVWQVGPVKKKVNTLHGCKGQSGPWQSNARWYIFSVLFIFSWLVHYQGKTHQGLFIMEKTFIYRLAEHDDSSVGKRNTPKSQALMLYKAILTWVMIGKVKCITTDMALFFFFNQNVFVFFLWETDILSGKTTMSKWFASLPKRGLLGKNFLAWKPFFSFWSRLHNASMQISTI